MDDVCVGVDLRTVVLTEAPALQKRAA
jgi:hypothetical protein